MEIKVRLFYDGKYIDPADYSSVVIKNKTLDRIINDVVNRVNNSEHKVTTSRKISRER